MKFPYIRSLGRKTAGIGVGPLHVCRSRTFCLAPGRRGAQDVRAAAAVNLSTGAAHPLARLIGMLCAAELLRIFSTIRHRRNGPDG